MKAASWLGLGLLIGFICAAAQADPATITFSLDFPHSDPDRYSISVDSDGRAKYECSAKISEDSDEREPYRVEFHFSPGNRTRIFALAEQAHYFGGNIDSGNPKIAFTGAKKLTYRSAGRTTSAEYNYSGSVPVQELTDLFQRVSATMEFGRRLFYYHRFQKLALDEQLKRMESQARDNQLAEIQAVEPTLREIFEDSSVMNFVRARAQRLIEMGKKEDVTAH
ncbi:MAG TPA: hypothetical protein VI386_32785 [Candidatus Sulfotelmatobacter sp.]